MKFRRLTILFLCLTVGCATTRTSMIVSDRYDQNKNETTLTLIPYGNINIPGQWTKTNYNEVSRQYFFIDNESTSIAVTKNPQEKYPFYTGTLSDGEFVRKFFEWEKDHYEKQGFEIDEKKLGDNFIIWTAKGNNTNTILLYGVKNGFAYNFAVFTDDWTEETRIKFLTELFEMN